MEKPIYHLEGVVKAKSEDAADFIGPLDLILHLLSKNKIEIQDISVSQILDQYLEWVERRKHLDMEVASDFIAMASHLMYIKSRMLLSSQDEEALSEVEQLIASLEARKRQEEYQKIQAVLPEMRFRYEQGSGYLTRPPEAVTGGRPYRYSHPKSDLHRVMLAVRDRSSQKLPPPFSAFQEIVRKEPYSVGEKAKEMLRMLGEYGKLRLRSLFAASRSRSELVAAFVAVLELIREKRICLWDEDKDYIVGRTDRVNEEQEFPASKEA